MFGKAATNTKERLGAALDAVRKAPLDDPKITPYIGYRGQLSQVWINRWTVLLLLVLARFLLAIMDLNDGIGSAQREALSACTGVESAASAMASMPHYMAQGTNELVVKGVEHAIAGLMSMLLLTVTGVEELVLFVINMLTSTYVCLITLAISGSLHVAIGLIEDVTGFLNTTLGNIGNDINNSINSFESDLNSVISGLNDVPKLFGSSSAIPTLDVNNSISALDNLQLPSGLDDDLNKLNASIPTFAQVQNFTNNAIRFPFEEIKKLINESLPNYPVNSSMFPVPAKEQLRFCSDNSGITSFFADLIRIKDLAKEIAIVVLIVLAIAVMLPMGWREARRYRMQQRRAELMTTVATNNMDVIYIASRPYTAAVGLAAAGPFTGDRRRALVRWAIAYATTPAALFVLSLGAAGLFSALCQYILLRSIQKEVPALSQEVGAFADKVVDALNNASFQWANGTNTAILDTNNRINNDLFGWVNTSTTALNDTLNVFVSEMSDALNATFGGTVLYDPITEVLNCLIGLKIASVQKGLTWVQDHAHIDFPLLANDTFSIGAAASLTNSTADDSFLADPGSGSSDKITAAVDHLINKMANAVMNEAIISGVVLGVWVIIALIGICRALSLWWGHGGTKMEPTLKDGKTGGRFDNFEAGRGDQPSPTLPDFARNEKLAPVAYAAPITAPASTTPAPTTQTRDFAAVIPGPLNVPHTQGENLANTYNGVPYTLAPKPMPRFGSSLGPEDQSEQEKRGNVGVRRVGQATNTPYGAQVQRKSVHPPVLNVGSSQGPRTTFGSMGH